MQDITTSIEDLAHELNVERLRGDEETFVRIENQLNEALCLSDCWESVVNRRSGKVKMQNLADLTDVLDGLKDDTDYELMPW